MKLTYIHHSGFLAETGQRLLLFDFAGGTLPQLDPKKALTVFVSHRHSDHFSPDIFQLPQIHPQVSFVLSHDIRQKRIPEEVQARTIRLNPGQSLPLNGDKGLLIHTFPSTDEGVAFMVEADGQLLFHAGDLNDWQWKEEPDSWNQSMHASYLKILSSIHSQGFHPHIAMLPLDGRQEEELCGLGLEEFMELVGADLVFPMHLWGDYSLIPALKRRPQNAPWSSQVADIHAEGQCFSIR